jgi:hypothetical protein
VRQPPKPTAEKLAPHHLQFERTKVDAGTLHHEVEKDEGHLEADRGRRVRKHDRCNTARKAQSGEERQSFDGYLEEYICGR